MGIISIYCQKATEAKDGNWPISNISEYIHKKTSEIKTVIEK
jgi:hypothetical protein